MLEPHYEALQQTSGYAAHCKPTYNVTDAEKAASVEFLTVDRLLQMTSSTHRLTLEIKFTPGLQKAKQKKAYV